ncbi:Putative secreted protein [Streptomyces venezuelae]|uniref:hypothetical protein n=1 Tax=Streptomyces gardneri TaxID=66892 RepID=UPI0006BC80E5|nr:hypothetical protein [Streptomyces gardneri]ALO08615.1 Putative secreted protein [Streptomyces venezuelae]QPK45813.1 hypothetical protein H4W23_14985 [Streptomyces gardneri]WRK37162.1 hypothetical protein U0M97_15055 [Streptomyces venezuelae]CUM41011.1 putative secreted protein [Streptomyces venezuelae]
MRRGLVHALAWSLATGAAVTLSWWGVHTVLSGTVYDPPLAVPLPVGTTEDAPVAAGGDPLTSSTRLPETPGTSPPSRTSTPGEERSASATPSSPPATTPADRPESTTTAPATTTAPPATTPASTPASSVKSYTVDGGRVTFDLGETSAELVSAIPASGWQMQVWKQPTWIRVTFTKDGRELSVFCLWHDTAPRVEIEDRAT